MRRPISARTSGRPEANNSAKYLGRALTMEVEVEDFACAVVLCTFCCGEAFG